MPELPEVQVVINYLSENVLCQKIMQVDVNLTKLIKNTSIETFKKALTNTYIKHIHRRGKYLLFELQNNKCMVVHLRMEGKFFYEDASYKTTKHDHIVFHLQNKTQLIYNDTRQFGTFEIYDNYNIALSSKSLTKLGPEPFDKSFNDNYFIPVVKKSNKYIKTFLLDQSNVVGIGNIYADEILFACKIHPLTKCSKLSKNNILDIINNTRKILKMAIKHNGTTIHTFKFNKWSTGDYQKYLQVHLRKNKPCKLCGNKINKIIVNGRGTYYCPTCQKEK